MVKAKLCRRSGISGSERVGRARRGKDRERWTLTWGEGWSSFLGGREEGAVEEKEGSKLILATPAPLL